MTLVVTLIRFAILLVFGSLAFMGILSVPADDAPHWLTDLILSKVEGLLAMAVFMLAVKHWHKVEKWVLDMDEASPEMEDANPK